MTDFFVTLYGYACPAGERSSAFELLFKGFRLIVRWSANFLLPIWFCCTRRFLRATVEARHGDGALCISLTTFPARVGKVHLAIETLLRQKKRPDAICLWLSREQFPSKEKLPCQLRRLERRGVEIYLCEGDLKSHKKYYYAMTRFPNDTVVLADDDIFYPSSFVRDLANKSHLFPLAVVGRFTKRILKDSKSGEILPYSSWPAYNGEEFLPNLFFGSGGGVLIPASSVFRPMLNINDFQKVCPYADDIWLNAMCRCAGSEIFSIKTRFILLPIMNKGHTLSSINNGEKLNDVQIRRTIHFCRETYHKEPF